MTIAKQTIFAWSYVVFGLVACTNSNQQHVAQHQTVADANVSSKSVADNDTIVYDHSIFPVDSTFTTKVLRIGTFHGDEVGENTDRLTWFGLFKNKNGYFLKRTKIKVLEVYDPIVDENENEKTGREVQTNNNDTCLILIEPLPYLTERTIQSLKLPKDNIYPNDTVLFKYSGIEYKIFATGGKKKVQETPEWFDVWNYKLYVTATIKGKVHKSLLVAQPKFDDQMINVIFAGDIDGDGILDLIIDVSGHYNSSSPTIYLSRPAKQGEVVKPIGGHTSVGC